MRDLRRTTTAGLIALLLVPAGALAQDANDPDLYRPAPRPKKDQAKKTVKKVAPKVTITPQQLQQGTIVQPPAVAPARAAGQDEPATKKRRADDRRAKAGPESTEVEDVPKDRGTAPAFATFDPTPVAAGAALARAGRSDAGAGGVGGLLLALGLPAALVAVTTVRRRPGR